MAIEFSERCVPTLHNLAAKLLDSRKHGTDLRTLARDLLRGFHDTCLDAGLDRVVDALGADPADRSSLADNDDVCAAVVAKLDAIDLDGRGPRNAKPRQVIDCLVAALGLTVAADTAPTTTLGADVRAAVVAAIAGVIDPALVPATLRDAILTHARAACPDSFRTAFSKVAAELDERGMQMLRQPKIPLDAMQAIQRALSDARASVLGAAAGTAIDRAKAVIATTDADVAARIDRPVSLALTPREVAIRRATDARVHKTAPNVIEVLITSLGELARIAWVAPEATVLRYAASATFAVGDIIEHPKFGRGTVVSRLAARIEVEFPDGKVTLVHAPPRS